jgi:hypothetical protein
MGWASTLGGGLRPQPSRVRVSRIVALHHASRGNLRVEYFPEKATKALPGFILCVVFRRGRRCLANPHKRVSAMNRTWRLVVVVALTALASLSLNLYKQSTLDSQLNEAREEMKPFSFESVGTCGGGWGSGESSGSGEPYADAEAYEVYSALIPQVSPNPETKTWFIRIDTLTNGRPLGDQARKLWKQTRGADTALDDYFKVNRKIWLLQRNFTLPNPYRLVTREQLKAIFPDNFRGGNFGELWLELSAVGFNADKTLAVVYIANFCTTSCCCAEWNSYVLRKQNRDQTNSWEHGKWKVSSKTECGIS